MFANVLGMVSLSVSWLYDQIATAGDHIEKVTLYKHMCSSFATFSLKELFKVEYAYTKLH